MQISNSNLSTAFLTAGYSRTLTSSVSEQLSLWSENSTASGESFAGNQDELILSDLAQKYLAKSGRISATDENGNGNPQMNFLKHLLEDTFGVKIGVLELDELSFASSSTHVDTQTGSLTVLDATSIDSTTQTPTQTNVLATSLDYSSSHYESQKISLSLEGSIRTKDGQELGFKLDLNVSQEFAAQTNLSMQASELSIGAPLTVDFDGLASELKNILFSFGLDSGDQQNMLTLPAGDSEPAASGEVANTDEAAALVVDTTDTVDTADTESDQSSPDQTELHDHSDNHHKAKHTQGNHYGYSDKPNGHHYANGNKHDSPHINRTG